MTDLTRADLANAAREGAGISKAQAAAAVDAAFEAIASGMAQGVNVRVAGFGIFKSKATPARMAHVPSTGKKVPVPASRRIIFSPSTVLKDRVKQA